MLRKVIKNFDSRSGAMFYESMANVARRLYIQGRTDECTMLLDATACHIKVSHGPDSKEMKWLTELKEELQEGQQFRASSMSVNSVSAKLSHLSV
jgi:hypothetical protein